MYFRGYDPRNEVYQDGEQLAQEWRGPIRLLETPLCLCEGIS